MTELETTISKGSWVLVTGATSYVASHIIKQFLERGYKVRGTVRNASGASWIVDQVFKAYADTGSFELATVLDIDDDHAFDEAVKGVSAIVHVATIGNLRSLNPDPNEVIPQTIAATTSILSKQLAALKEPSVKQFLYTSSTGAAAFPSPEKCHVERDSWNDLAVQLAWAPPPYGPHQGFLVYMASKVAAEKVVWKIAEKKPHFVINVVSPGTILGEPLHRNYIRSTGAWVPQLYDGKTDMAAGLPATVIADVKDVALVHVAAVLDPEVDNARLQVWGRHSTWNDVLTLLRKIRPKHHFVPNLPGAQYLGLSTDESQVIALLKKWRSQDGWRPLEETLADNLFFASN